MHVFCLMKKRLSTTIISSLCFSLLFFFHFCTQDRWHSILFVFWRTGTNVGSGKQATSVCTIRPKNRGGGSLIESGQCTIQSSLLLLMVASHQMLQKKCEAMWIQKKLFTHIHAQLSTGPTIYNSVKWFILSFHWVLESSHWDQILVLAAGSWKQNASTYLGKCRKGAEINWLVVGFGNSPKLLRTSM